MNSIIKKIQADNNQFIIILLMVLATLLRFGFASGMAFDFQFDYSKASWDYSQFIQTAFAQENIKLFLTILYRGAIRIDALSWATFGEFVFIIFPLSLLYFIFGPNTFFVSLLPIIYSIGTLFFLYLITAEIFGKRTAYLAAFLWAILPLDIFYSSGLFAITPFIFFTTLFVWVGIKFFINQEWKYMALLIPTSFTMLLINFRLSGWVVIFIGLWVLKKKIKNKNIETYLLSGTIIYLLINPTLANDFIKLYQSLLLIKENLILFPLLLMSLFVTIENNNGFFFLKLWFSSVLLYLGVGAHLLLQDPLISVLGTGSYWLIIILPACVFIAQYLANKCSKQQLWSIVSLCTTFMLAIALLNLITDTDHLLFQIAVIFSGLTFLLVWLGILPVIRQNQSLYPIYLRTFLAILGFGLVYQMTIYSVSYSGDKKIYTKAYDYLQTVSVEKIYLQKQYISLFEFEMGYENQIGNNSVELIAIENEDVIPVGSYIVISKKYQKFELVIIPDNWDLVAQHESEEGNSVDVFLVEDK